MKWLLLAYVPTPAGAPERSRSRGHARLRDAYFHLVDLGVRRGSRIKDRGAHVAYELRKESLSSTVVIGLTTVSSCASSSPLADSSAEDAAAGQARGGVPAGVGVRVLSLAALGNDRPAISLIRIAA